MTPPSERDLAIARAAIDAAAKWADAFAMRQDGPGASACYRLASSIRSLDPAEIVRKVTP